MTKNALIQGLLASLAIDVMSPVYAEARFGGQTDESVCDVGRTDQRSSKWPTGWEFVRAKCKNGQALMANGIVPVGGFDSEAVGLARAFCRMSDIQSRRTQGNMAGLVIENDEVRCTIEKLPK